MTEKRAIWPHGDVWVGERFGQVWYGAAGRTDRAPPGSVSPLIGPRSVGGPVLWLDARGTLTGPSGPTPLAGLMLAAGDPGLLLAVRTDRVLLLTSEDSCTSVELPAPPLAIAGLAAGRAGPFLGLVALREATYGLIWQSGGGVTLQPLCEGTASDVVLLRGTPPLAAVRQRAGAADRLLTFMCNAAPWRSWSPLPPLLIAGDQPSRIRQTEGGPCVRVGPGAWLVHRLGTWSPLALPEQEGVPTLHHARYGALEHVPWPDKEHIPVQVKLAVTRRRYGNPELIRLENSSQAKGGFVSKGNGG